MGRVYFPFHRNIKKKKLKKKKKKKNFDAYYVMLRRA